VHYSLRVGPGSYNIPPVISNEERLKIVYKESPRFTFARCEKLRLEPTASPGVGRYSPSDTLRSSAAPAFAIGSGPKTDAYWDKKLYNRSPGPVYNFTLDCDSASQNQSRHVVPISLSVVHSPLFDQGSWCGG
jgi:hypothetical protein